MGRRGSVRGHRRDAPTATRTVDIPAPFAMARSLCLLAARAAGVAPIDAVFTDFRDSDELNRETDAARRDGFSAKAAIHPLQVGYHQPLLYPNRRRAPLVGTRDRRLRGQRQRRGPDRRRHAGRAASGAGAPHHGITRVTVESKLRSSFQSVSVFANSAGDFSIFGRLMKREYSRTRPETSAIATSSSTNCDPCKTHDRLAGDAALIEPVSSQFPC